MQKSDGFVRETLTSQEARIYRYHRNTQKRMEHMATEEPSLETLIATFLTDLAHANHSPQTCRAYATDLAQFCAFHLGSVNTITADMLQNFFSIHSHLRPTTRARKQAAMATSHHHRCDELQYPAS